MPGLSSLQICLVRKNSEKCLTKNHNNKETIKLLNGFHANLMFVVKKRPMDSDMISKVYITYKIDMAEMTEEKQFTCWYSFTVPNYDGIPFLSCIRSSHSLPPFRAGLSTYLTMYVVPVASTSLQVDQSDMIHGSGTVT